MNTKFLRRSLTALILTASCLLTTSCGVEWDSFMSSIGFDTRDYASEAVIKTYDASGEFALELASSIRMLTLNTPSIEEFESSSQAIDLFRDTVLNHMLTSNYSRYTGDIESLDEAAEAYPTMQLTNLIPAAEFEQQYYKFFGGSTKITNKNGTYFMYLPKLEAYTALSEPQNGDITVAVLSLEETENTYRLRVTLTLGETSSPVYNLLLIKREDGTFYFKSAQKA